MVDRIAASVDPVLSLSAGGAILPRVCRPFLIGLFLSTTPLFAQWPSTPHTISLGKGLIAEIGLSPADGVLRITTSAGVWLHDPRTLELRHLLAESVDFSRFSDDGQRLAGALEDTSIVVWDVDSGRVVSQIRTQFTDRLTTLTLDLPGARVAAGSRAGEMAVWDVITGDEVARMQAEAVRELVFDHPESRLVSANGFRAIRVWDLDTSREVALLSGHEDNVRALALHPGGRWLASGSIDFTVRIWDLDALQSFRVMHPGGQTVGLEFDPSGRFLAERPRLLHRP